MSYGDDFEYSTSVQGSIAIMREIERLTWLERNQQLIEHVARALVKAGVDFSKAKLPDDLPPVS